MTPPASELRLPARSGPRVARRSYTSDAARRAATVSGDDVADAPPDLNAGNERVAFGLERGCPLGFRPSPQSVPVAHLRRQVQCVRQARSAIVAPHGLEIPAVVRRSRTSSTAASIPTTGSRLVTSSSWKYIGAFITRMTSAYSSTTRLVLRHESPSVRAPFVRGLQRRERGALVAFVKPH